MKYICRDQKIVKIVPVMHNECSLGSFQAQLYQQYTSTSLWGGDAANTLYHFVVATPTSTNIVALLRRFCSQVINRFSLTSDLPQDYK